MAKQKKVVDGEEKTKAEKKLIATVGQEAVDALNEAGPDELKAKLVTLAGEEREIEEAIKQNEELADAKENAKNMEAPYKDRLKGVAMLRKYAAVLLEQKGKL